MDTLILGVVKAFGNSLDLEVVNVGRASRKLSKCNQSESNINRWYKKYQQVI
jgi:hypothetical protein